jgi:hypothetical protein
MADLLTFAGGLFLLLSARMLLYWFFCLLDIISDYDGNPLHDVLEAVGSFVLFGFIAIRHTLKVVWSAYQLRQKFF